MAYAALVSLSQTIEKLQHHQDQYPIPPHEKQQIISMHERSILFQAFLEDYSEKTSSLEGRIRDAANEAEDIIEFFMWKQIDQQQNYALKSTAGMCFDFKILKKVAEEIESIAGVVMEIKNSTRRKEDVQQLSDSSSVAISAPSSRLVIGSTSRKLDIAMVGFEDDLMTIKARLCGESSKLQVIPIFGMGGIGKTTLAKNAYDDQLTVEHFQIRAWVTVSQDYNAPHILSSLLASVEPLRSEESDESKMAEHVYKSLTSRRYLIVMDDVWTTKAWDDMRRIFPNDHNGSRIILTTRLLDVATYPDSSSPPHKMDFMDADQSWNLLRQKVFPQGNCPPQLENIGKTIARSCRGLPLAIVVIAGLLSTVSPTRDSWENIARNVNEVVTTNDEQFAEIVLSLSYNQLPHHLRSCFLYMGAFPEDYEIRVSKLTKLWVAEGFLKLQNGSKSWEEVAEEYLEDIVKRSLVLVTSRKSNGKIKSCSVHDLVRDLCIRKAQQEKFLVRVQDIRALQESIRNQPRVSISPLADLNCLKDIHDLRIRTIICIKFTDLEWDCLQNIRFLRVFDVVGKCFGFCQSFLRLPPQIIKLFHLRYLTLPHQVEIPAAISILENLQTLIIYDEGWRTTILPFGVFRLRRLRHLVLCNCYCLPDPEGADFALEHLQTLSQVQNLVCTREILQMIPNLKKLGISYFEDQHVENIELENFVYLHQLEKLTLNISGDVPSFREMVKPVFPTSLKKLTLGGTLCSWEDMGIIGSLPNLEVLKLRHYACDGDEWETREGEFLKLKYLLISVTNLKEWITESSHFPRLKFLVLQFCWRLREIPDGIGEIPTLELIEVGTLNTSLVGSAMRIQEERRQNWGNDALQVRAVYGKLKKVGGKYLT